jgi:hypothetical protein
VLLLGFWEMKMKVVRVFVFSLATHTLQVVPSSDARTRDDHNQYRHPAPASQSHINE